jgi:hypothetical protein
VIEPFHGWMTFAEVPCAILYEAGKPDFSKFNEREDSKLAGQELVQRLAA